jgi:competence protein ComEA
MPIGILAALLCAAAGPPSPQAEGTTPAAAAAAPAAPRKQSAKPAMTGVLNVNRATEAELRLLPGVGKRRAQLIIERRDKKPFASIDEIGRIKGMRALVQRLRSRLAVQGDTTLRPLRP